ncbi:MAG: ABATE domain-containing protein, partial [Microbacteriaceae bacterium]
MRHSPSPSGQWLVSEEGTRWFFDSGAVSLDFAATAPSSAAGGDKLVNAADLGGWLAERFERVDAASATERDLADALRLRAS